MTDGSHVLNKQWSPELDQEQIRVQFYERYCMVAEEYDRKLTESYHKKMDGVLIPAGMFSIQTLANIIHINSLFQPGSKGRTLALLCDLVSWMGNLIYDNTHTTPRWSDPLPAIIRTQVMLYASLTAFMFSAFIAMLGKQWLYHYASTIDIQGSATERGRNRQREFDRLVTWQFHRVMRLPEFMIRVGIWLLCCTITCHPSNSNTTLTGIALGFASLHVVFSLSAIVLKRPS